MGFGLAVLALSPVGWDTWPLLLSRFVGLGPGACGSPVHQEGWAYFEARGGGGGGGGGAAVSLLQGPVFGGVGAGTVALYRLISTFFFWQKAAGYGAALLLQQLSPLD